MASLFGAIIFVPQEEFGEAIFTCLFFLLILSEFPLLRSKSAREVMKLRKEKKGQPHIGPLRIIWVSIGWVLVYAIFYLIILYLEGLWN